MKLFHTLFAGLALLLASTVSAKAAAITVGNSSFESAGLDPGGWSNDLGSDWTGKNGANDGNAFLEHIAGFSSEGTQHVGMANLYYLWQDTGVAWEADTTYNLVVGVGHRGGFTAEGNKSVYALLNAAPDTAALATAAAVLGDPITQASGEYDAFANVGANSFLDAPVLQFTTGGTAPDGNIFVFVGDASAGGRSHFDNIRLSTGVIPEPGSATLLGLSLSVFLLRRRR